MILHRLAIVLILTVWTWLLLKPNPVPTIIADNLLEDLKFVIGKTLHFAAYAFLACCGTWRMQSANWKWIWLLLLGHAIATELGQHYGSIYFDTHRTGSVRDVLIDLFGIAAGATLRRRLG